MQQRALAMHNLVMAERQDEVLGKGIDKAEGQVVLVVPPVEPDAPREKEALEAEVATLLPMIEPPAPPPPPMDWRRRPWAPVPEPRETLPVVMVRVSGTRKETLRPEPPPPPVPPMPKVAEAAKVTSPEEEAELVTEPPAPPPTLLPLPPAPSNEETVRYRHQLLVAQVMLARNVLTSQRFENAAQPTTSSEGGADITNQHVDGAQETQPTETTGGGFMSRPMQKLPELDDYKKNNEMTDEALMRDLNEILEELDYRITDLVPAARRFHGQIAQSGEFKSTLTTLINSVQFFEDVVRRLTEQFDRRVAERARQVAVATQENSERNARAEAQRSAGLRNWSAAVTIAGALLDAVIGNAPRLAVPQEVADDPENVVSHVGRGANAAYAAGLRCVPLCELAAVIGRT